MKKTKNNFMFLAAAMLLLGTSAIAQGQRIQESTLPPMSQMFTANQAPASAPTVTHDYAWYASKTYTWTDANGTTRTASLVDEVTNPYQMFDMLRWVYCNPEIPGNKTTAVTNSSVYYGEQYLLESYLLFFTRHVDPGWGISNSDVTAPYEDGHTLFLVKLKNYNDKPTEYTSSKADIINYLSRYIESIQIITNGMRAGSGNNAGTVVNIAGEFNRFFIIGKGKSFYWEPQVNSDTPPLAPFYNMFEEYSPTTTDEGAEITDFYEAMNNGAVFPIIHDCGSVIYFEHYFSMDGKDGTEEKSMSGMTLFIPDNRNAYNHRDYDNQHQPSVGMYVIDLEADAAPADAPETYDVTLDWSSTLNQMAKSDVPQTFIVYVVVTDEFGNQSYEELVTTTETSYTYQVPQGEHSYTINYIVHGVATQNEAFDAWSNIDDVIIPGTNDFLSLVGGHYESDYVPQEELNYYRNYFKIENEDVLNALTPARVEAGENEFTLYRFDAAQPDVKTPVAILTINTNLSYSIEYLNQEPLEGYPVTVVTEGDLTLGANNAINLEAITLIDQFNESTALNDHPSLYGYELVLNSDPTKGTNTVEVPVLKTGSTINGFYTLDEVMADVEPELEPGVKNAEIEMPLVNNPAIYYYTIQRGDNAAPTDTISRLQRRIDGSFVEMNNALGHIGEMYYEGDHTLFDDDVVTGAAGESMSYVPVIWSFGSERVNHDGANSYGSPIWTSVVGDVNGSVHGTISTTVYGEWRDENGNKCAIYNPTITVNGIVPDNASVTYEPFMYRVWRLCDDVRGYTIDPETNTPVNDPTAPRDAKKLIIEEMTNESTITIGDEWDLLGFGARVNTQVRFLVRFYYKKVGNNLLTATGDDAPMYYVVETMLDWNDIHTGVNELTTANEVSKTYYNTQGIASDTPFKGVNIVVTRYSDGTTRTSKVVK